MTAVPLSVLDLSPISTGATATEALRNTIDLAQHAEQFGYHRYWLAEHHLALGVASAAPAVLAGVVASATARIRVGSGAVQLINYSPLVVLEQFGVLASLFPGRIDLGIGRALSRRDLERAPRPDREPRAAPAADRPVPAGLLIPPKFSKAAIVDRSHLLMQFDLLEHASAEQASFAENIAQLLAFLRGTYRSPGGLAAHAVPGEGADLEVWIFGSSAGQSAKVAGAHGLPFAANYHFSPGTVLEAVDAYRDHFRPSSILAKPYVIVSADAVVAADEDTARELASGHGLWVRSIRRGQGAIPFPTPAEAAAETWTEDDRALVADRVDTQLVGSAPTVAGKLRLLQQATAADELVITTITHDHADRVRSYELLAKEWLS